MLTYSYTGQTSKINIDKFCILWCYMIKKNRNINCNYRRISFHNKEAVCSHINKPINTAYLRKCLHCYIEANKLRSNYSSGTSIYSYKGSNLHPPWTVLVTVGKFSLFTKYVPVGLL